MGTLFGIYTRLVLEEIELDGKESEEDEWDCLVWVKFTEGNKLSFTAWLSNNETTSSTDHCNFSDCIFEEIVEQQTQSLSQDQTQYTKPYL